MLLECHPEFRFHYTHTRCVVAGFHKQTALPSGTLSKVDGAQQEPGAGSCVVLFWVDVPVCVHGWYE